MKHEKAPTAPRFEWVLTISYMPLFWKFKAFGQFWPTSVGRNCQKAHLYAKTFHMSLFPGLYDHPLQRNSLEKHKFRKPLFWTFWSNSAISGGRIWSKLSKGTSTGQDLSFELIPRSLRPSVTKIQPGKAHVSRNRCFF